MCHLLGILSIPIVSFSLFNQAGHRLIVSKDDVIRLNLNKHIQYIHKTFKLFDRISCKVMLLTFMYVLHVKPMLKLTLY